MNVTTFKAKYSVLNECFLKRELFVLLTKIHELETFCKRYNLIQTNLKQINIISNYFCYISTRSLNAKVWNVHYHLIP